MRSQDSAALRRRPSLSARAAPRLLPASLNRTAGSPARCAGQSLQNTSVICSSAACSGLAEADGSLDREVDLSVLVGHRACRNYACCRWQAWREQRRQVRWASKRSWAHSGRPGAMMGLLRSELSALPVRRLSRSVGEARPRSSGIRDAHSDRRRGEAARCGSGSRRLRSWRKRTMPKPAAKRSFTASTAFVRTFIRKGCQTMNLTPIVLP
jgi:hypothetical protein